MSVGLKRNINKIKVQTEDQNLNWIKASFILKRHFTVSFVCLFWTFRLKVDIPFLDIQFEPFSSNIQTF